MRAILTAVGTRWDDRLATELESSRELDLVRRCADLADLLAAAEAGLGTVALVSEDVRGLDLGVVGTLRSAGLAVVGASVPGDEGSERRLRQIGIDVVVAADAGLETLEEAVTEVRSGATGWVVGAEGDVGLLGTSARWRVGSRPGEPDPAGLDGHAESDGADGADGRRPPGRVVAVWGPTGAPGRTTVAVNVAAELAGLGLSTLLVDADTYGGSVAQVLSMLDEAPGIAAAARAAEQGTLDLPVLARLSPQVLPHLRVLSGIPRADRWLEIRAEALERVLALARLLVEVVVLDCGFCLEDDEELSYDTRAPRRNAATLTALGAADTVVAVGTCDPVGLQRLVRGLQELAELAGPTPVVVVNRVRPGAVGGRAEQRVADALQRFAGVSSVRFVPDDPGSLDVALLQGRVLAECAAATPVRSSLRALAASVAGVADPAGRRSRRR